MAALKCRFHSSFLSHGMRGDPQPFVSQEKVRTIKRHGFDDRCEEEHRNLPHYKKFQHLLFITLPSPFTAIGSPVRAQCRSLAVTIPFTSDIPPQMIVCSMSNATHYHSESDVRRPGRHLKYLSTGRLKECLIHCICMYGTHFARYIIDAI